MLNLFYVYLKWHENWSQKLEKKLGKYFLLFIPKIPLYPVELSLPDLKLISFLLDLSKGSLIPFLWIHIQCGPRLYPISLPQSDRH